MSEEIKKDMSQKEIWKLAVEIWKLEKRLNKIDSLDEEEQKATSFLLSRINKIIEWYNVKIIDYTWQKFLEGMTWIDILSAETHKNLEYPIIWETVTPAIEINWLIVQRAKVVINTPETVVDNQAVEEKESEESHGMLESNKDSEQEKWWKKGSSVFTLIFLAIILFLIFIIWFIYCKMLPTLQPIYHPMDWWYQFNKSVIIIHWSHMEGEMLEWENDLTNEENFVNSIENPSENLNNEDDILSENNQVWEILVENSETKKIDDEKLSNEVSEEVLESSNQTFNEWDSLSE